MGIQIGPHLTAFHVAPEEQVLLFLKNEFQLKHVSTQEKTFRYEGSDYDSRKQIFFDKKLKILTLQNQTQVVEVVQDGNWNFLLQNDNLTLIESIVSKISRKIEKLNLNLPRNLNENLGIDEIQKFFQDFEFRSEKNNFYRCIRGQRHPFDEINFNFVSNKSLGERGQVNDQEKDMYSLLISAVAPAAQAAELVLRFKSLKLGP